MVAITHPSDERNEPDRRERTGDWTSWSDEEPKKRARKAPVDPMIQGNGRGEWKGYNA